jgi:uncharacterized membrane protein YphA (DoxX/SURF4 family)
MNNFLFIIIQLIVAFGLLNVWLVRSKKETAYRGGNAKNIIEEFRAYGLPVWFCYLIGFLKVSAAIVLIIGIWVPDLALPAAALLLVLMLGAVSMHIKVKDPVKKAFPAVIMVLLNLYLVTYSVIS